MSKNKNVKLILDTIKYHYKFKTNLEFAAFLGIKPSSLSTWYARNMLDYDLVHSKCEGINANWLMTGEGEMFENLSDPKYSESNNKVNLVNEAVVAYSIDYKDVYLRDLEKQVELMRNDIRQKSEIIQGFLNGQITKTK